MNKQMNAVSIPKNTPQYIIALLHINNRAVERAMVVLHENKVQPKEVKELQYYTSWVNAGRKLSGFHLERARMIALSNVSYLVTAATKKLQYMETFQLRKYSEAECVET